jgi:hypothetical protein
MHHYLTLALLLCTATLAAKEPAAAAKAKPIDAETQRVLSLDDALAAAEVSRDEATLSRIIDDRFLLNGTNGTTTDKATLIKNLLGWKMTAQKLSERTIVHDGDTAVIFGTSAMRFATEDKKGSVSLMRYTATYIKRDGQWRALALQMNKHTGSP